VSTYTYPESKVVEKVSFKTTANGAKRAYLSAKTDTDLNAIKETLGTLRAKDWECSPFSVDGKPVLEVRGFSRESELITFLSNSHITDGKPTIEKQEEDRATWKDMLLKRSLQASGAAMMAADFGFIMYGAKEKSLEDTLAGLAYMSGSATLLAYGRNDQSQHQIRQVAEMIVNHAREKGLEIPEESAAATIGKERKHTALRQLSGLFERNPSEIGNLCYAAAGSLIASSALRRRALATPRPDMTPKQIKEMRMGGWGDVGLGTMTISSGLLAATVKEKARDSDEPRKTGLAGIAEWIQERPLRLASYGYMASTMCHAVTTFLERKEAKRVLADLTAPAVEHAHALEKVNSIPWRVMFVSLTLVGEFLLSISSKGHGEGVVSDHSVDSSSIAIAADLIAKQPKHMQDQLVEAMGKFLGRNDVLAYKDQEAIDLLRKQVETLHDNPWAKAESLTTAADAAAKQKTTPAPALTDKPPVSAWQAKIASTEPAATSQLQSPM
jgi:hypothetical protein